jgi:hypothetical protein
MTVENEELSEDSLFDQAVGDEGFAPNDEIGADAIKDGKLVDPEPQPEPEAQLTPEPEKAPVDDNAPQVPSWRVREINEERRAALAERDALRAEKAQWEARQRPTEQPKPAEQPAKPDPLLDPEGYEKYIEAKVEDKLLKAKAEVGTDLNAYKQRCVKKL